MLSSLRRPIGLALGAGLLAVAACSDSTGPNGSLTPEEINELAVQMGVGLSSGLVSSPALAPSGARLNAIPAPISASVEFTIRCPRGGTADITASVEGTIDDATESAILDVSATQESHDCGYPVHGKTVRVSGSLTANAHVEVENGLPTGVHTASLVGEFDWRANDGRRGSCTVNYTATANYTENSSSVSGDFCGATIQFNGPLTAN
jgi:hypothetical protein